MEGFEKVLLAEKPDIVIVVGDVNSTVACALVTKKTCWTTQTERDFIPKLVHVEADYEALTELCPKKSIES